MDQITFTIDRRGVSHALFGTVADDTDKRRYRRALDRSIRRADHRLGQLAKGQVGLDRSNALQAARG